MMSHRIDGYLEAKGTRGLAGHFDIAATQLEKLSAPNLCNAPADAAHQNPVKLDVVRSVRPKEIFFQSAFA
jgi:hypothetical protein